MQSKGMTYLLIGAFVLIWVMAGFRVYKAVHQDEEGYGPATVNSGKLDDGKADSFSLLLNYQDPFEISREQPTSQGSGQTKTTAAAPIRKEAIKLPVVAYRPSGIALKGVITNNTARRKVALISIQGKEVSLKEKETVGSLTLLKVFNDDSVRIDYDGHQINLLR